MFVDTNFIVELLREQNANRSGPARSKLESIRHVKLQIPLFVLCELRAGALQSSEPEAEIAKIERLVEYLEPVYPAQGFAATYAETAALLRSRGTPIPLMDLLIATLVKWHGSPILTRDREHFERVPGVVVESF
jgi:predicted nucleic acid-binding protein